MKYVRVQKDGCLVRHPSYTTELYNEMRPKCTMFTTPADHATCHDNVAHLDNIIQKQRNHHGFTLQVGKNDIS